MNVSIEPTWKEALKDEFALPYFKELSTKVRDMYLGSTPVYPPPKQIFNAFELCPFDAVKVVILGQDPYHGPGQAHGLSFSVEDGVPLLLSRRRRTPSPITSEYIQRAPR